MVDLAVRGHFHWPGMIGRYHRKHFFYIYHRQRDRQTHKLGQAQTDTQRLTAERQTHKYRQRDRETERQPSMIYT